MHHGRCNRFHTKTRPCSAVAFFDGTRPPPPPPAPAPGCLRGISCELRGLGTRVKAFSNRIYSAGTLAWLLEYPAALPLVIILRLELIISRVCHTSGVSHAYRCVSHLVCVSRGVTFARAEIALPLVRYLEYGYPGYPTYTSRPTGNWFGVLVQHAATQGC